MQINGKVRDKMVVASGLDAKKLEALVLAEEKVQQLTAGMTIVKMVCVPDKLVNIVVKK